MRMIEEHPPKKKKKTQNASNKFITADIIQPGESL